MSRPRRSLRDNVAVTPQVVDKGAWLPRLAIDISHFLRYQWNTEYPMIEMPQTTPEPLIFFKALEKAISDAEAVDWKATPAVTEYKLGDTATISLPAYPKRTGRATAMTCSVCRGSGNLFCQPTAVLRGSRRFRCG